MARRNRDALARRPNDPTPMQIRQRKRRIKAANLEKFRRRPFLELAVGRDGNIRFVRMADVVST